ncbi:hypothetical protein [Halomonas sp. hl-4]|uniref:hypothetical protein n=1 Tax=Halomonas sp. hl-4 TaxID=1761789 RepID=UPI000BB83D5D|nr:hypothetical protein [Halomonas sp. hl-4]SNY95512.1 hypothetical protein SAMN04488142_0012 [Halomonas sp. hl-4]
MQAEKTHTVPESWVDPRFVQITRKEAARILGRSPTEFDRMRKSDPECPQGFKTGADRSCSVLFRLSDVYDYSAILMDRYSGKNA